MPLVMECRCDSVALGVLIDDLCPRVGVSTSLTGSLPMVWCRSSWLCCILTKNIWGSSSCRPFRLVCYRWFRQCSSRYKFGARQHWPSLPRSEKPRCPDWHSSRTGGKGHVVFRQKEHAQAVHAGPSLIGDIGVVTLLLNQRPHSIRSVTPVKNQKQCDSYFSHFDINLHEPSPLAQRIRSSVCSSLNQFEH